jgi:predicted MFS family arabinose efflux permease
MALRFGGRGAMAAFYNIYLDTQLGAPTALIGVFFAASQLLAVPAALAAPLATARWGNPRTIASGTLGMALCMLPVALIPRWGAAGTGFISSTALFYLTMGPMRLFSQELVAPRWRSTMAAAFMLGAGLGFSVTAWTGGRLIPVIGYQPLFLAGTVLVATSALLFWTVFRVPRGEIANAAEDPSSGAL